MGWVIAVLIFGSLVLVICTSWGKAVDHDKPLPADPWPSLYAAVEPMALEFLRAGRIVALVPTADPVSGRPRLELQEPDPY